MFTLLSHLRNKGRSSLQDKARHMNASTRTELSNACVGAVQDDELLELDRDLQAAREQLAKAVESEAFVAMRIQKYAGLLKAKRRELMPEPNEETETVMPPADGDGYMPATPVAVNDTDDTDDDDDGSVLSEHKHHNPTQKAEPPRIRSDEERLRHLQRLQRDEAALATAGHHHATLVQRVIALRTTIRQLQRKRNAIDGITQQVKDFLVAAAEAEGTEEAQIMEHGDDDDIDGISMNIQSNNNSNSNHLHDLEMQLCRVEEPVNDVQEEKEEITAADDGALIEQLETGDAGRIQANGTLATTTTMTTTTRNDDDEDHPKMTKPTTMPE